MKVLVVPTNRPANLLDFLGAWEGRGGWDRVVVVYDGPKSDAPALAYAWEDIDRALNSNAWIISRKDSAIRSFGYLVAWHLGADCVLTLDDDCFPEEGTIDFFAEHIDVMQMQHNVWIPSADGPTRGTPYENLGTVETVVNVGLWREVGDLDAPQTLAAARCEGVPVRSLKHTFSPTRGSGIVPAGQLIPMCGMNLCFYRDAVPLMYFPLMGQGQPYARFDDIWAGVICKKVMDKLGWRMSVGEPHVKHLRASDPFKNLVKEAPGIAAHETFWETVWNVELQESTPAGCMMEVADVLGQQDDEYVQTLGDAIVAWVKLFEPGAIECAQ